MLEKILTKEDCRACQFCCAYRRQSLWETPLFTPEKAERLKKAFPDAEFKEAKDGFVTLDLDGRYQTDDPEEEARCWFNKEGCALDPEDKPFDCAVWPFRIMKRDNEIMITLDRDCPALAKIDPEKVRSFLKEELSAKIWTYISDHPEAVQEYKEHYDIIEVRKNG